MLKLSKNDPIIRNKECIDNGKTYNERKGKSKSEIARNGCPEENKPKRSKH